MGRKNWTAANATSGAEIRKPLFLTGGSKNWRHRPRSARRPSVCEFLENRVMLSGTPRPRVDAGDFYYYFDQKVPLLRATDEVVVGLLPTSAKRARRLSAALTADGGPLQGYYLIQTLKTNNYLFKRSSRLAAPGYRRLLNRIEGLPALKYLGPTFFSTAANTPARLWATDEVTVKLIDPSTASQIFIPANGYSDFRAGVLRSVIATLADGGGLAALRAANAFHGMSSVAHAEPNFFTEVISSLSAA